MVFVFIDEEYKMSKTLQQKADEAHNMCKLKGDSMLDNADRQIAFEVFMIAKHKQNKRSNFSRKKQNRWKQRLVKLSQKSNRLQMAFNADVD